MTAVIGIDPGLFGTIAVLGMVGRLTVTDMPTVVIERNGREKRELDAAALAAILRAVPATAAAWLERVGAMPGQGVSSMFAFGRAVGVVEGVLAAAGVPVSYVAPAAWKRALAVSAGKDGARLSVRHSSCPPTPRSGGARGTTAEPRRRLSPSVASGGAVSKDRLRDDSCLMAANPMSPSGTGGSSQHAPRFAAELVASEQSSAAAHRH